MTSTLTDNKVVIPGQNVSLNERIPLLINVELGMKATELNMIHIVDSMCFRAALEVYCQENPDILRFYDWINTRNVFTDNKATMTYMNLRKDYIVSDLSKSLDALMIVNEIDLTQADRDNNAKFISMCEYYTLFNSNHSIIDYFSLIGLVKCLIEISQQTNIFLPILTTLMTVSEGLTSFDSWVDAYSTKMMIKKYMKKTITDYAKVGLGTTGYQMKATAAEVIMKYIGIHANLHGIQYFVEYYRQMNGKASYTDCIRPPKKLAMCKDLVDMAFKAFKIFTGNFSIRPAGFIDLDILSQIYRQTQQPMENGYYSGRQLYRNNQIGNQVPLVSLVNQVPLVSLVNQVPLVSLVNQTSCGCNKLTCNSCSSISSSCSENHQCGKISCQPCMQRFQGCTEVNPCMKQSCSPCNKRSSSMNISFSSPMSTLKMNGSLNKCYNDCGRVVDPSRPQMKMLKGNRVDFCSRDCLQRYSSSESKN